MGLKKYEIITVGSDKRVRALRSWQVGDRYINIGDVGGIVYDEKTLSQDGACWLFRGNFGFPGARIGGDSIVDVGEAALSAAGSPAVDILGSSVVVGGPLKFEMDQTATDAVVLNESFFEQGDCTFAVGSTLNDQKTSSPNVIRLKNPIFMGGVAKTVKLSVPGFAVTIFGLDADLRMVSSTPVTETGGGVILTIPASQYWYIRLRKNPLAPTVPADATTAAITFTGTYETKLSVIDSRVEINPATATGVATIKPGGVYAISPGAKYPEAIIRNSKVSMMVHATANRVFRLMGRVIGSTATLDATAGDVSVAGQYSNIKNLMASGTITPDLGVTSYNLIQATDCDNFAVSPTIFPGLAAARTANMPFIFRGCNVPGGVFYHHAQIANTYKNLDFALAQADLGKATANVNVVLVSSEVGGMYRIYHKATNLWGPLTETLDSVISIKFLGGNPSNGYATTIYKDAYFNGEFDFAGTNVFGNKVRSHPLAQVLNVQPRAVQGGFTLTAGQPPVPNTESSRVRTESYFRLNGANGISVQNIPAGLEARIVYLDGVGRYVALGDWYTGSTIVPNVQLINTYAYLMFRKTGDAAITPEDLAGVTVTVYNGCKIVNTGATAVNMKGNIRVEDNATLVNASVTGSGYFGGNSVVYYNPTVWASLDFNGTVYMKDNVVFAPTALTGANALVRMEGNAKFTGSVDVASTNLSFIMRDNAVIEGKANTRSGVVMSGNSKVTATGQITAASRGVLVMEENASIEANTTVIGAITLSGNYKGNAVKTWTGKRTITDVNAPEYDNNVKTQYDF